MIIPLYRDLPDAIEPRDTYALICTCLSHPADHPDTQGFEVIYCEANGWRKEERL